MTLVPRLRAIACLIALLALVPGGATAAETLSASLRIGEAPGEVVFELRNDGVASVDVLRLDTPLEDTLAADVFELRRAHKRLDDGERPVYVGRRYKRAEPVEADFVTIAPGGSVFASVDLESHYDVPAADTYRVDFRGSVRYAVSAEHRSGSSLRQSAGLTGTVLSVRGPDVYLEPTFADLRARPPQFNACTVDQQNSLIEATSAAEGIAGEALSSLRDLAEPARASSPRYTRWFGAYTPRRYERVIDNFEGIFGALVNETLTYDCSCDDSSFAFVYPRRPYDIYLCRAFFAADLLGTDSRAGTLVHELSHFEVVARTDDFAYGSSTLTLANENPDRAIMNADSHEYFAENTPALPMSGPDETPVPEEPRDDDPGRSTNGGPLEVGATVNGSLSEGRAVGFSVEGPLTLTLTSLSGDADLYVYDSTTFDEDTLVCLSENATTEDVCEIEEGGTFYAGVRAHHDATFRLSADDPPGPTPIDPVPGGGLVDDGTDPGAGPSGGSGGGGGGLGWTWLLGAVAFLAIRRRSSAWRHLDGRGS